jgi:hypothetical protein
MTARCGTLCHCGKIERMGATSRDHVAFVLRTLVFGRGKPFADLVNDFRCAHAHPEMEDAMKSLAILSLILGVVVTSVPAQAQTRAGTQVQSASFNGLFFDKSATGGYEGYPPPTRRGYRTVARQRN